MDIDLAQKAVSAALSGNWQEAVNFNKKILKENPKDIDALNRFARAYAELGDFAKAKKIAEKVLKIDPFNSIATKAAGRWKNLKTGDVSPSTPNSAETFLEEPGKTKIVYLLHPGSQPIVNILDSGDEIRLDYHCRRIAATTKDGKYIGRLPDDLSSRMRKLVNEGYEYLALIKSIEKDNVKIFIREIQRGNKKNTTPSFPVEKIDYISFTPPELVNKKEVFSQESTEEELTV